MTNEYSRRSHESWLGASNASDDEAPVSPLAGSGDWEDAINGALAEMIEHGSPVERTIAARLLLAEFQLGRLTGQGPEELMFAPEGH